MRKAIVRMLGWSAVAGLVVLALGAAPSGSPLVADTPEDACRASTVEGDLFEQCYVVRKGGWRCFQGWGPFCLRWECVFGAGDECSMYFPIPCPQDTGDAGDDEGGSGAQGLEPR